MRVALLRDQLEEEIDKLRGLKLSADNLDNQNQEKGTEGSGVRYSSSGMDFSNKPSMLNRIWCRCFEFHGFLVQLLMSPHTQVHFPHRWWGYNFRNCDFRRQKGCSIQSNNKKNSGNSTRYVDYQISTQYGFLMDVYLLLSSQVEMIKCIYIN